MQVNGVNVYAATTIGYFLYSLGQVFLFCIFGNRLIEEVILFIFQNLIVIKFNICHCVELVGNGSGLFVSLVRWIRRSKDICTNCVSTMSKSHVNIGRKVFHSITRSVCFGKKKKKKFLFHLYFFFLLLLLFIVLLISGTWGCGDLLHGVGTTEIIN